MADKKKMSVADMLAAARKSDGKGSGKEDSPPPSEAESSPPEQPSAEKSKAAPAKSADGGRLSVADMMAKARGEKKAGSETKKPAAKPKSPAKAAAKPAAKKTGKEKAAVAAPKDTASILAAARSASRKGPMSKAEAAKSGKTSKSKPKIAVPPMPVKPSYAKGAAPTKAASDKVVRRGFLAVAFGSFLAVGFIALAATTGLFTLALARFMFPNVLCEPPSQFKVGFPDNFAAGQVETKYKAQFGIWIVSTEYKGQAQLVALKSVCTHLGCTPNWLEAEQKFKCPCHGSGFYKDGINFEGPAPRPLERYGISIADDGQILIDKSQLFQEEMGAWADSASFISV